MRALPNRDLAYCERKPAVGIARVTLSRHIGHNNCPSSIRGEHGVGSSTNRGT